MGAQKKIHRFFKRWGARIVGLPHSSQAGEQVSIKTNFEQGLSCKKHDCLCFC